MPEIELAGHKVNSITQVKVDGAVLANTLYRIDDYRYLVRLPDADGTNPGWPLCQNLTLADTEEDTFSVSFSYGELPATAVQAAAELGCQLALACNPTTSGECQLPKKVVSVSRQGVSYTINDPQAILDKGQTGLYFVDLFLQAFNPNRIIRRASAHSPDVPSRWRRAGT